MTKVSIVIPVFNAANILKESIDNIISACENLNFSYEILLRDDCSKDNSPSILRRCEDDFPNIKCFYNADNKGLGFTLRKLLESAEGEFIFYVDADLPFGTKPLAIMIKAMTNSDIVLASRYKGKSNKVQFMRKLTSRAYAYICKLLFGLKIKDVGSGTVGFKRSIIEKLDLISSGFAIHAEIFLKAEKLNARIEEIGFESYGSRISSFSILKHGLPIIIETFVLRFSHLKKRI